MSFPSSFILFIPILKKIFRLNFYIIYITTFLNIAQCNLRVKSKDRFLVVSVLACFKLLIQVMCYCTAGEIMASLCWSVI